MNLSLSKTSLKTFYDRDYFESGKKSGYKNYNKGLNFYKHRLRDYQRALHLIINFRPKRVLDLGCAFGYLVMALRSLGVEAYGVDMSEYSIKNSLSKIKPFVKVADISSLPFDDNYFDLVVSYDVLEHISQEEIPKVIKEVKRVCSGGVFMEIFTDKKINKFFKLDDPSHISVFPKEFWTNEFKKAGFKQENFFIPLGFHLRSNCFNLKSA